MLGGREFSTIENHRVKHETVYLGNCLWCRAGGWPAANRMVGGSDITPRGRGKAKYTITLIHVVCTSYTSSSLLYEFSIRVIKRPNYTSSSLSRCIDLLDRWFKFCEF